VESVRGGREVESVCGGKRGRGFEATVERWLGFEEAKRWRVRKTW